MTETVVNGITSVMTGKIAGKIVPTNNGWFKPKKLISCLIGKYAIKSELQTFIQSDLLLGYEIFKNSISQRFEQEQQPTVTFFPDTKIQPVR